MAYFLFIFIHSCLYVSVVVFVCVWVPAYDVVTLRARFWALKRKARCARKLGMKKITFTVLDILLYSQKQAFAMANHNYYWFSQCPIMAVWSVVRVGWAVKRNWDGGRDEGCRGRKGTDTVPGSGSCAILALHLKRFMTHTHVFVL